MRMKLLHSCGYNVNLALEEYHRLQVFGWEEDISWTRAETMQLDCYLQSTPIKDFTTIARKLHRSRSECLVQYYRWKSTSPAYHDLKKRWKEMNHHQGKNDYCCVCGDGGDLLVCDRCDDPYHLGCVKPSLDAIPAGDWFCSRCIPEKSSILSSPMSRTHSSSPMSKWWSQPTRVANGLVSPDKERVLPKQIVSSISGSIPKDDLISTGTKNHSGICLPVTKAPHRLKSDSSFSGPVESSRTHITGDIDNIESDASIVSEPADV